MRRKAWIASAILLLAIALLAFPLEAGARPSAVCGAMRNGFFPVAAAQNAPAKDAPAKEALAKLVPAKLVGAADVGDEMGAWVLPIVFGSFAACAGIAYVVYKICCKMKF